ncbi:nuclear transport factor 2 family protein [Pseudactinotalea sp.]|uniref:nuclear transport factor 2 family protein n=1 Tax=Pseudactinotalea sp. TaxID=1926260 RepID=UPI003B3A2F6D
MAFPPIDMHCWPAVLSSLFATAREDSARWVAPAYGDGVDELASVVQRLEQLESINAIRDLVATYCWGADHRDLDTWNSVWAPDAIWKVGPARSFVGVAQIRQAVQQQWAAFPAMLHSTANHRVEINGDRATGVADVTVMTQLGDGFGERAGAWVSGGGTYHDAYIRIDGSWYLSKRDVTDDFLHGPTPTFQPAR